MLAAEHSMASSKGSRPWRMGMMAVLMTSQAQVGSTALGARQPSITSTKGHCVGDVSIGSPKASFMRSVQVSTVW